MFGGSTGPLALVDPMIARPKLESDMVETPGTGRGLQLHDVGSAFWGDEGLLKEF